jgi:hypothetical protein
MRVIVLSDMPWRSKLARRIIPLPAALRVCLLVLVGSFFGSIPAQASNVSLPVSGPRLPFAIDDFDGDHRPDLASVQQVSNNSSDTIYRVQFQLSAVGQQSIHLVGPSGGLRIATRDVNGDDIPDLIVSSAWREETLAVLVNDGRGAFSLADPSSFPTSFGGSGKTLNCKLPPQTDTVATAPRLPVGDFSGSKYLLHPSPATSSIPRANFATLRSLLLESLLGRAPPTPSRA